MAGLPLAPEPFILDPLFCCVAGYAMGWRIGGVLLLAVWLAGCAELSGFSETPRNSDYAMATPEPVTAPQMQPQPVPDEPPAVQNPTPPPGKFGVQVAAPRSVEEARALIDAMRAKHPDLLGKQWASISRIALPGGVFYRVTIGPLASEQQALQLCSSLKAEGSACFIRRT
jgi:cell division septation protein DedD